MNMNNHKYVLQCEHLSKSFKDVNRIIPVLTDLNFEVAHGEHVAIIGRSGSGKTTLVNILGGLDAPTKGKVYLDGIDIHQLSDKKRGYLRNHIFGFIFQSHHLLPEFTALENVCMPLLIRGMDVKEVKNLGNIMLDKVGLKDRVSHKPFQLSGGERQRVAIARALVTRPKCILADEPTGNLDEDNANEVYDLMVNLSKEEGTSFVVVTHDKLLAQKMNRIVVLENGQLNAHAIAA